ncbi:MAG: transcriptional regulator, AraC family [Bacteroidetes bacterium]|jgi:AraC-like DNA-binding protein/mannose-6-phosphate isomerase-like protein (cupin superfamily)|nr:transcriptional regulator, AraC family [Bacteroidota bacterium]
MATIPVHDLMIKDLQHAEFDIIALNGKGERNYDGIVPHRHNFFELLVFSEGGGVHEVDFRDYDIMPNSLHFVSPTQVHKLKANTSKGFVLCFTHDAVYSSHEKSRNFANEFPFYNFNVFTPHLELDRELFKEIFDLVISMNNIFNSDHPYKKEIIRSYLNIVLLKIKHYFLENAHVDEDDVKLTHHGITAFKILVDKYYSTDLNVQGYSDKLRLSPNYLNSLCKKETGKTAIQLIHERVLLEARRLLYSTNLSVKEISFALNFKDVAYFNRFFKKNMSITPSEYRQHTSLN